MKKPYVVQRPALPIWISDPLLVVRGKSTRGEAKGVGRSPGRRPSHDSYSVAQVALLVLQTSQLWLRATSGEISSTRAEASCPRCWGKRWLRQRGAHGVIRVVPCPVRHPDVHAGAPSAEEIADSIADAVRDWEDPETIMVAIADLAHAWERLGDSAKNGLADFVKRGPRHLSSSDVEFERSFHQRAVLALWRSVNGFGEFSRRKEDDAGSVHGERAQGGHVQRLPAGDPPDHDGPRGQDGRLGRGTPALVA